MLLAKNPLGEHSLLDVIKGEIIAVSDADLVWTAAILAVVVLILFVFKKEFLLVSFDREMAITLKKNVLFWDALLFLLIGLTISMSVLSVGPMVTFGFLLLPPLIAHQFAANMRQFACLASATGGVAALVGFATLTADLPVGRLTALLGGVHGVSFLAQKLFWRWRPRLSAPQR